MFANFRRKVVLKGVNWDALYIFLKNSHRVLIRSNCINQFLVFVCHSLSTFIICIRISVEGYKFYRGHLLLINKIRMICWSLSTLSTKDEQNWTDRFGWFYLTKWRISYFFFVFFDKINILFRLKCNYIFFYFYIIFYFSSSIIYI